MDPYLFIKLNKKDLQELGYLYDDERCIKNMTKLSTEQFEQINEHMKKFFEKNHMDGICVIDSVEDAGEYWRVTVSIEAIITEDNKQTLFSCNKPFKISRPTVSFFNERTGQIDVR